MSTFEITFKPKYNGSMRFAFYLWPVWTVLFLFFIYRAVSLHSWNPDGFLVFVFGIMTLSMPYRVFKEMRFERQVIIKRYFLPDVIIEYGDIVEFNKMTLAATDKNISLYMMHPDSFKELEGIIHNLMSSRKIKLKKTK